MTKIKKYSPQKAHAYYSSHKVTIWYKFYKNSGRTEFGGIRAKVKSTKSEDTKAKTTKVGAGSSKAKTTKVESGSSKAKTTKVGAGSSKAKTTKPGDTKAKSKTAKVGAGDQKEKPTKSGDTKAKAKIEKKQNSESSYQEADIKAFDKKAKKWHEKDLDSYGQNAIKAYTDDMYSFKTRGGYIDNVEYAELNHRLNTGKLNDTYKDFAKELDLSISKFKLDKDIKVYRGMDIKELQHIKSNATQPAYKSASLSKPVADRFAKEYSRNGYSVTILVPKGTKGAYIGDNYSKYNEQEFLVGRGQKYRILKQDDVAKTAILEVY